MEIKVFVVLLAVLDLVFIDAWSGRPLDRRNAVAVGTGSLSAFYYAAKRPAFAAVGMETFTDKTTGIEIDVPSDWIFSEQKLPDRRTLFFWRDPNNEDTLIFMAFTPVRDDFTSLGSFGNVDQVAAQTILPKGKIAGFDVDAKMISAFSAKQAYFFDYVQTVPNVQPTTHFRTIFTLRQGATGGAGAVLVTITAQSSESRYEKEVREKFDRIVESYRTV